MVSALHSLICCCTVLEISHRTVPGTQPILTRHSCSENPDEDLRSLRSDEDKARKGSKKSGFAPHVAIIQIELVI
jgi:hypothetical protein